MAEWGTEWGELWGTAVEFEEDHCGVAADDLPDAFSGPKINELLCSVVGRIQELERVIAAVDPAYTLDVSRTYGEFLDRLGEVLNFQRRERTDDEYRRALTAWSLIIRPKRRTSDNLIEAVQTLVDPALVRLIHLPPKRFVIVVTGTSLLALLRDLTDVINISTPATYQASLGLALDGPIFGYYLPEAPPDPDILGYGMDNPDVLGGSRIVDVDL